MEKKSRAVDLNSAETFCSTKEEIFWTIFTTRSTYIFFCLSLVSVCSRLLDYSNEVPVHSCSDLLYKGKILLLTVTRFSRESRIEKKWYLCFVKTLTEQEENEEIDIFFQIFYVSKKISSGELWKNISETDRIWNFLEFFDITKNLTRVIF